MIGILDGLETSEVVFCSMWSGLMDYSKVNEPPEVCLIMDRTHFPFVQILHSIFLVKERSEALISISGTHP